LGRRENRKTYREEQLFRQLMQWHNEQPSGKEDFGTEILIAPQLQLPVTVAVDDWEDILRLAIVLGG
jgi:hypothetical protein